MIKIVSSQNCPYCDMAKGLLTSLDLPYEEIDITWDMDKLMEIVSVSWLRTVPQIFSGDISKENLLWGYDDISRLNNEGKLLDLLK